MSHQTAPFDLLPDDALIRESQLVPKRADRAQAAILPFSASTLWRLVRSQKFPQPFRLPSGRVTCWRVGDVRAWLRQQAPQG